MAFLGPTSAREYDVRIVPGHYTYMLPSTQPAIGSVNPHDIPAPVELKQEYPRFRCNSVVPADHHAPARNRPVMYIDVSRQKPQTFGLLRRTSYMSIV